MIERFRLDGPPRRAAIVTGGGRGLGREMALSLAQAGADVCIVSRTQAQLDATAAFIEERTGRPVLPFAADLSQAESADRAVDAAVERFGRLDIMVANAGIGDARGGGKNAWELDDESWADALAVNLTSTFACCRAALRQFRAQASPGAIITVSSGMAMRAAPTALGYSAAKGGVISFTRTMAAQAAAIGVRANCIVPGFVVQAPPATDEGRAAVAQRGRFNTLRRLGEAWELGPLAVFLASDASSYITGETFVIDGGGLAGGIAPLDHIRGQAS